MDNGTPFGAEIRKYEAVLAKDPRSFCFAPLSDVYRRAGMLDEALDVALRGCEMHPDYLAGYMALGRACYEKGLLPESRQALEKVVAVMPDNLLAHNLLAEICRELGDGAGVRRSETAVRAMTAEEDDVFPMELPADDTHDDIVELTDVLELEEATDDVPLSGFATGSSWQEQQEAEEAPAEPATSADLSWEEPAAQPVAADWSTAEPAAEPGLVDLSWAEQAEPDPHEPSWDEPEAVEEPKEKASPISTATIAELYVSQGFTDRALGIYRELLAADPDNEELKQRVAQLTASEGAAEEPVGGGRVEAAVPAVGAADSGEWQDSGPEDVIAKLEGWLENIRRRR